MNNSMKISYRHQQGIAALLVTVLIALIATTATIYANRGSLLLQKTANNNYQQAIAQQAAEVGANAFIAQIEADLAAIAGGATTGVILKPAATGAVAAGCAPAATAPIPYEFLPAYIDADAKEFGATKYYPTTPASVEFISALSGANITPTYRVRAKIDGSNIYISSEGLADAIATAKIRKTISLKGGINLGNSALTVGGYFDAAGSATIDTAAMAPPHPVCPVLVGESYASAGAEAYTCKDPNPASITGWISGCTHSVNADIKTKLFEKTFGMTKPEMEASLAPSQIIAGDCNSAKTVPDGTILLVKGNIEPTCAITGANIVVIALGNVKGGGTFNGLLYASNYFPNGSVTVNGSAIIEGGYDFGPLAGQPGANPTDNAKNDAATGKWATHSAQIAMAIHYKPYTGNGGLKPVLSNTPSSWIDF